MVNNKLHRCATMNLKEPKKKKKRSYLQPQPPLPIDSNENGDWTIYTAHLSASGTCIVDPVEMEAVYSMGFFGKGSLSRSFPSFGKRRYGVPPIARNRQWIRRQKWLDELQSLNENNGLEPAEDLERTIGNKLWPNPSTELANTESDNENRASTSKQLTPRKTSSDQADNNSEIEFESSFNEPRRKMPKMDNPMTIENDPKVEKNKNTAEIAESVNNEKNISVTTDKSEIINEELKNTSSVKTDENLKTESLICKDSVKVEENHKKTDSTTCESSVKVKENHEKTDSMICKDSVKGEENHEKTDSMICEDSVKAEENHEKTDSMICEDSVKAEENHEKTDSMICEDSVKAEENHEKTDSVICEGSVRVQEYHEKTDSVICEGSVRVQEYHEKTDSVICEGSVKAGENHDKTDSVISEDSVNVDENQKTTDSIVSDGSIKVEENRKNSSSVICDKSLKVDEVVLDSTEDEEICEIVQKGSNDEKDVYFLNEAEKSDEYFKYRDTSEIEEDSSPYEILVLPDTDSDTENYLTNIKSKIEKEGFPINETLHLTFEETFFLMYGLGCLQLIHYDGSVFSISNAWNHFQQQDKNFIQKYVVYHYFRSKGWVVKPGLKFGGDFLLYKQGPPFYHASYIIIIEVVDADTLIRDDLKSMRKVTWKNLIGLERLSETIAKEILFAQILWPSSVPRNGNQMPVDALSEFTVRELLWRRWDRKRKKDFSSTDDEDSDST